MRKLLKSARMAIGRLRNETMERLHCLADTLSGKIIELARRGYQYPLIVA
jgi:hypothetical protein